MADKKPQLDEKKQRKGEKPKKDKPKPVTLEQLNDRVKRIEQHLSSNSMKNAEFAFTTIREMTQKIQEMMEQTNIMGGYLSEKELIDDCNKWYEDKIAEETKKQQEMMEQAKAARIKQIEEAAKKMKEADKNEDDDKGAIPADPEGKGNKDKGRKPGKAVQDKVTEAEKADGGRIKQAKK